MSLYLYFNTFKFYFYAFYSLIKLDSIFINSDGLRIYVVYLWSEVKVTQSCPTLWTHGLYSPWNSPGQNTGVGSFSLLPGISPTQGSNPGLPHCRWILYQLSHKWNLRILEWVANPFASRCSQSRNRARVSCIAGGFFTSWTTRKQS